MCFMYLHGMVRVILMTIYGSRLLCTPLIVCVLGVLSLAICCLFWMRMPSTAQHRTAGWPLL